MNLLRLGVAALAAGVLGGCASGGSGSGDGADFAELERLYRARTDSALARFSQADVAFVTGMIGHHGQAIEMAEMVPDRAESGSVRTLAARIINAQRDEISLMERWLEDRGQPLPAHDAMDHAGHLPGMLSAADLAALRGASGAEFDRLFLTDMIRHHQGAIAMVETSVPFTPGKAVLGISSIGPWLVFVSVVIPQRPGVTLAVTMIAATTWPVAYAINAARFDFPTPPIGQWLTWPVINYLMAFLSFIAGNRAFGTACRAQQAEDLGSYRLVSLIGEGGMGEVWKASHQMLARRAAIKLVRPLSASSFARQADMWIERFRREANVIASLQSPHTIYLYDFGVSQDGRFYYDCGSHLLYELDEVEASLSNAVREARGVLRLDLRGSVARQLVLTQIDADSATFENPAHDFPKKIRYVRKPDGTMEATISGDPNQRTTTFVFRK